MSSHILPSFVALALLLASCHPDGGHVAPVELPPASVRALKVEKKSHAAVEDVVGTVRPKLRARVEAKVSGRVEQLLVNPGQSVKAGELLAVLDAREIQARLDQASAVLTQADKDFQRLQPLLQSNAISKADLDATEARKRVAASSVVEAETMLGYTKISAPFDGVITRKLADVGDLAMPGKPLLEIEAPASLRFEADVPEALIDSIKLKAVMPVVLNAATEPLKGTVVEIAPVADPGSRTYLVKLDLPVAPAVRAGQFGRVQVPVGTSEVPFVPASAVTVSGQMELVKVIHEGRVALRIVKTGKRMDGKVEVISGLEAGESIVIEGEAKDGQRVEVKS